MPIAEERRRIVKRYFTKTLPNGKYLTCSVVKKKGTRGGTTICSEPKEKIKG